MVSCQYYQNHTSSLLGSKINYLLKEIDSVTDLPKLVDCKWTSYEHPFQPFLRLYNPILGTGPNARAESSKASTARQIQGYQSDPYSHWLKVTDPNSGKIIAGAWWKFYPENPFENDEDDFVAFWFPEGGQRDYATAAIRLHNDPRRQLAQKPHVCKSSLAISS